MIIQYIEYSYVYQSYMKQVTYCRIETHFKEKLISLIGFTVLWLRSSMEFRPIFFSKIFKLCSRKNIFACLVNKTHPTKHNLDAIN